jgi:triacylglycerol lipase
VKHLLDRIDEAYAAPNDVYFVLRDGVLAFRGTEDLDDAIVDAQVLRREYALSLGTFSVPGGHVHAGFLRRWEQIRSAVLASITEPKPLVITGHSLGGAMAALAAIELDALRLPVKVVTFGAPRVGDSDFVRLLNHNLPEYTRVENWGDPVPWVPTYIRGWRHAGRTRYVGSPLRLFHPKYHGRDAYREALP